MSLLDVKNLSVDFINEGVWQPTVTGISFELESGEMLALVGESGCGKSVSCMALARLLPEPPARINGEVKLKKRNSEIVDVFSLSPVELRRIRGAEIAYIFQEPSMSLNPVFRVGNQIAEAITLHREDVVDPWAEAIELLRKVGIPEPESRVSLYPHEMSGGMQQRVMIAMALACDPAILVADEPTTALDVTIQAQILDLLAELRKNRNMSIILVTHNLGIVSELADRVAVMYAGNIVEKAYVKDLMEHPAHPYTQALINAVPALGMKSGKLSTIPGSVPSPTDFGKGCRFHERCALAEQLNEEKRKKCAEVPPSFVDLGNKHLCACHWCGENEQ